MGLIDSLDHILSLNKMLDYNEHTHYRSMHLRAALAYTSGGSSFCFPVGRLFNGVAPVNGTRAISNPEDSGCSRSCEGGTTRLNSPSSEGSTSRMRSPKSVSRIARVNGPVDAEA